MKAILFDMDGVLYNSSQVIDGAVETLAWVRQQNIPHLFVTNTSSRSRGELVEKLAGFGIAAREEQILTPAFATAQWLRTQPPEPVALFVLRRHSHTEFEGLEILPAEAESGAGYIVIGDLGTEWDFAQLNRAFRLLHSNPAAKLVALGMTRFWQAPDGLRLDVAPFVAALECAVQRQAIVMGKPAPLFFEAALKELVAALPSEVMMIGDDIEVDVGGAQRYGLKGVLVKTGKFRPTDLQSSVTPDAVLDSIADLPALWSELNKK